MYVLTGVGVRWVRCMGALGQRTVCMGLVQRSVYMGSGQRTACMGLRQRTVSPWYALQICYSYDDAMRDDSALIN